VRESFDSSPGSTFRYSECHFIIDIEGARLSQAAKSGTSIDGWGNPDAGY